MKTKLEILIAYLAARLSEISTWKGIAYFLTFAGSKYGSDLDLDQAVAVGVGLSMVLDRKSVV